MRKFLIWLSGARPEILDYCPSDRPQFLGLGMSMLIASAFSFICLSYGLIIALGANHITAVAAGFLWGVLILGLDRMLVASLQNGAAPVDLGRCAQRARQSAVEPA